MLQCNKVKNGVKKKASTFLRILADKTLNDLQTTKPSHVRHVLKEAINSLPDGVLKSELRNNNKLYYKKLNKIICKYVSISNAEESSNPHYDGRTQPTSQLRQHFDDKFILSEDASCLTSPHLDDATQFIELPCNSYHSSQRINKSVLALLQGELSLKTLSVLVSTRLHRLHSNSSLLEDWKHQMKEVYSRSQKLSSRWLMRLCSLSCGQQDPVKLTNLMIIVFSIMQQESEFQLQAQKIKMCHELKDDMRRLITFFYVKYMDTEQLFSEVNTKEKYEDLMASLLSIYLDLAVFCSRYDGNPCSVGHQCCVLVSYTLQKWPAHCLDVLLQMTVLTSNDGDVVMPILRKSITELLQSGQKLSHKDYTRVVICVRQMMALFGNMADDISQVVYNVSAPKSYISWLKERSESIVEELPDYAKFRKRVITRFLLQDADASLLEKMLDLLVVNPEMQPSGDVEDPDTVRSSLHDGGTTGISHKQDEDWERVRVVTDIQQDEQPMFFVDKVKGTKHRKDNLNRDKCNNKMEQIADKETVTHEQSINLFPETQSTMYGLNNYNENDESVEENDHDSINGGDDNDDEEEEEEEEEDVEEEEDAAEEEEDVVEEEEDYEQSVDVVATRDSVTNNVENKVFERSSGCVLGDLEVHNDDDEVLDIVNLICDDNTDKLSNASDEEDSDEDCKMLEECRIIANILENGRDRTPRKHIERRVTDSHGREKHKDKNNKSIKDVYSDKKLSSNAQLPFSEVNAKSPEPNTHSEGGAAYVHIESIPDSLLYDTESHNLSEEEIVYDSVESETCLFGDGPPSDTVDLAKHLKTPEQERNDFNKLRQVAMNAARGISLNHSNRKSSVTDMSTFETSANRTQLKSVSHLDNELGTKSDVSVYDFGSESSPDSQTQKQQARKTRRQSAEPLEFVLSKRVTRCISKSVSTSVNTDTITTSVTCISESDSDTEAGKKHKTSNIHISNQAAALTVPKRVTRARSISVSSNNNADIFTSNNLRMEPSNVAVDKFTDLPGSTLSHDNVANRKTTRITSTSTIVGSGGDQIFPNSPQYSKNYSSLSRRLSLSDRKRREASSRGNSILEKMSSQRLQISPDRTCQAGHSRVTRRSLALTQLDSSQDQPSQSCLQVSSDDQSPVKLGKTDSSSRQIRQTATPKKHLHPSVSDTVDIVDNITDHKVPLSPQSRRSKGEHDSHSEKSSSPVSQPLSQRTPRKRKHREDETVIKESQSPNKRKVVSSKASSPRKQTNSPATSQKSTSSSLDNLSPKNVPVIQQNSSREERLSSPLSSHTRSHTLMTKISPAKRRTSQTSEAAISAISVNSSDNLHQSKMTSFFNCK